MLLIYFQEMFQIFLSSLGLHPFLQSFILFLFLAIIPKYFQGGYYLRVTVLGAKVESGTGEKSSMCSWSLPSSEGMRKQQRWLQLLINIIQNNKVPETEWLKQQKRTVTVLEDRSPRSRYWQLFRGRGFNPWSGN